MAHQILDTFETHFHVEVTPAIAQAIIKYVCAYETYGQHPQALNSYMLGIYKCNFLERDRDGFLALFNTDTGAIVEHITGQVKGSRVFGIDPRSIQEPVNNQLKTQDIKKELKGIDAINEKFRVISDPFNLFVTYLLHKIAVANIPAKLKEQAMFKTLMFLQYKFFTSLVQHRFRYKPDEGIMTAMYEGLTQKFDLKVYGSWRALMENRALTFIDSKTSPHGDLLIKFDDDQRVVRFISDVQTRIRQNVNIITTEYMAAKERHDTIATYNSTGVNPEGETELLDYASSIDNMSVNLYNDVLNVAKFLDERVLRLVCGLFSNLPMSAFRGLLVSYSEYAVKMQRKGLGQEEKKVNGEMIYTGPEVFIAELIQCVYRLCTVTNSNFNKPAMVVKVVKDAFSSSRISDPRVQMLRATTNYYVLELQRSRREVTMSAMRIGLVLYLVIKAMKYRLN
jgi:hypothetical protein